MIISKRIIPLVLLGLACVCAQGVAAQSTEKARGQAAQRSKDFQLTRVWVTEELETPSRRTHTFRITGTETVRPIPGSTFLLIEFVLLAQEATTNLVLVDSAGQRYTPVGISPFSKPAVYFLTSVGGSGEVLLQSVKERQFPGGKVEVTSDAATGQLTIAVSPQGTNFAAAWVVPLAAALRRSEFKLHVGEESPIAIDTSADALADSLHKAVKLGDKDLVAGLIGEGAKVNAKDSKGVTPLHRASDSGGRMEVAKLLLAKEAEVNARDNNGGTPLHWAAANGRKDVVTLLLAGGADVNAKDNDGVTPLHRASASGAGMEVAELLLAKGAQVNTRDNHGWTPLHWAAAGPKDMVTLLLASGADVNAIDKSGKTPLHAPVSFGNAAVVELLLAKDADVNIKDNDGMTLLHVAAGSSRTEVASLLLSKGADVNVTDNGGKSPLDLAKTEEMKALLRKYGAK